MAKEIFLSVLLNVYNSEIIKVNVSAIICRDLLEFSVYSFQVLTLDCVEMFKRCYFLYKELYIFNRSYAIKCLCFLLPCIIKHIRKTDLFYINLQPL